MANLNEWAKNVVGRYIDIDGWAGAQCWDLSQAWLTACNGGVLWTQPSTFPGLAAGSWEVAMQNGQDLLQHVTAIPGTARGLPGDIIIWAYGSADYPISHTAVLIEDRGPILRTLSQNSSPARPDLPGYSVESSGPTIYQDLTRAGILGFLRPRATITGQSSDITPIKEDTLSAAEVKEIKDYIHALAIGGYKSGGKNHPGFAMVVEENQRRIGAIPAKVWATPVARGGGKVSALQELADAKTLGQQVKAENAALRSVIDQLAKGQGVTIDYARIDSTIKESVKTALADGIDITGEITVGGAK